MTQLLVSVRDQAEARSTVRGGADVVDIKDPERGSLGPADAEVVQQIVDAVGGHRPLSLAMGELSELDDTPSYDLELLRHFHFAKAGSAGCTSHEKWRRNWLNWKHVLPPDTKCVAAVYADWQRAGSLPPRELFKLAIESGAHGVLVDTYEKSSGTLFGIMGFDELVTLFQMKSPRRVFFALAGSLRLEHLALATSLKPEYVAVRGAVCEHGRLCPVQESRVQLWSDRLALSRHARSGG